MYTQLGIVTLQGSTLSGNGTLGGFPYAIASRGGGIFNEFGPTFITNSTVSGNRTTGYAAHGGGIFTHSGEVTITNSTLSGNTATGGGGGVWSHNAEVLIESSTVTGNTASGVGGGIGHSVDNYSINEHLTIRNSIIAGNSDNGTAPDFLVADFPFSDMLVEYSLVGDNTGTSLGEAQSANSFGNLIGSATGGGLIVPLLGPLADNGGPTLTHALSPVSPAINAGDPAVSNPDPFDQRGVGFERVQWGRIDLGAYEFQYPVRGLIVDTLADVVDNDYSLGELSLREAVLLANAVPGADTVTFAAGMSGLTILLASGELEVTDTLTIDASALAENVVIDALQQSRVLHFSAMTGDLDLAGLTLQNGKTTGAGSFYSGGGIRFLSSGTLKLISSTVSGNRTTGNMVYGGGVFAKSGTVTLTDSTLSDNHIEGDNAVGGGISTTSGPVTLTRSTLSGNSTSGNNSHGGGLLTTSAR